MRGGVPSRTVAGPSRSAVVRGAVTVPHGAVAGTLGYRGYLPSCGCRVCLDRALDGPASSGGPGVQQLLGMPEGELAPGLEELEPGLAVDDSAGVGDGHARVEALRDGLDDGVVGGVEYEVEPVPVPLARSAVARMQPERGEHVRQVALYVCIDPEEHVLRRVRVS